MTSPDSFTENFAADLNLQDREALRRAVELLEKPSFAARLADLVGAPIEKIIGSLPEKTSAAVQGAVTKAIREALAVAIRTIDSKSRSEPPDFLMKVASGLTGGVGGFFGLPGLAVELPVTTTVMLRAIADIARSEGENLDDPEPRLACLEVFALGGKSSGSAGAETGYYAVRAVLSKYVSEAAKYIAERGLAEEGAPVLVRLITSIAGRFGVVVSEKVAAGAVPVAGAIGGATVNVAFMDHFQNVAHGHFIVRRLERKYGKQTVRAEYERCLAEG